MRARFNSELDSNIASLIFQWLSNLDLCLSRAVCKNWWRLIPKQTLTFKDDFFKTLVEYDRLEYVSSVQKWTTFVNNRQRITHFRYDILIEKKSPYAAVCFHSLFKQVFYITMLFECCNPSENHWNDILLPRIRTDTKDLVALFWEVLDTRKLFFFKKIIESDLINWNDNSIFQNVMLSWVGILEPMYFDALKYLKSTKKTSRVFWEELVTHLWKHNSIPVRYSINRLVELYELCEFVPEVVCERATPEEHQKFNHVCGCEKVIIFKRQKK
jgi:hypothetical protein